ncbi:UvrD-helicase domain-containing protein [Legionella maceachernii]|uniref:DNA 3'-5' helicase n=1 Tax=Legionella maceachernii TaxID=466 RepID=A0A0W0W0W0_9GAMM|nr:UvrD-helicase domain-containing protein [Legionella maceachernii]KTD25881.1 UvrD/REP helicase [Legionella maceachernii]SJZ47617.1 ATP-dependent exoDNAse (exonuclease V) beta subunit (contains helicase and exonuclease domains) [Legionella maceachernii]SUP03900.1 ATP-dependent helicase/nuclease subunit A [Legionella maceachernii]
MLKDSQQRTQATDPRRSFIVQAPAGSGKTEILTQRYLRLLSTVNAPEQIVALTFTRKAASEMRERILSALKQVACGAKASTPHQEQTYRYAADALTHADKKNWRLLDQPGRLRIITIDSLCQMLSHAIPLPDQQVPFAQISESPEMHYRVAAKACLTHALEDKNTHQPLKTLLTHLDNRQDKILELFSELLSTRDQWLSSLYSARMQSKANYEEMLAFIEQHELSRFVQAVPLAYRDELCSLACQMAHIESNSQSPRYALREWENFNQINRKIASGLASLLLTSEEKLRKGFDHHVGLKRGSCEEALFDKLKADSKALLLKLDETAEFLDTLIKIKNLPKPQYDPEQWQVLQALFVLLPLLVSHLHVVFTEQNEVDFSAIAQQALTALGDDEQPTDLALYLDNTIQHLLIDEFQDTSIQQFQLLTKLVQGWQPNDGRTLFVVGDPMQSIYRFRQAEVGLFLKAKQTGIGDVHLDSLELCCNFRSTATIVGWVNQQFSSIFPQRDDVESGAISFSPSHHVKTDSENSTIGAWQFTNRRLEAHAIVECVTKELEKYPEDQIAILVRSRTQLREIVNLLREQNIPFQGVDIEHLAGLPHLRDLWSLTQALLLPANRLAWLALLRSPFCGLSLIDLHVIANFDRKKSIYYALSQSNCLARLSEEGQVRAQFIYAVLHDALARRYQHSLVDWISHTLKQLHVDKILSTAQQEDLEQFWLLLERFTHPGKPVDLKSFKIELDKLYSQRVNPSRLQVMTIHKSKGLEFDCVLLPSLSSKSQNKDQPMLRWLKLPSQKQEELLLVSPIKAAHQEQCLLYDYLGQLDNEKDRYELQRLFYVAATRAKKRLYLFDSSEKETKGTFRSFLKNQPFLTGTEETPEEKSEQSLPLLYRLPIKSYLSPPSVSENTGKKSALSVVHDPSRQIGIVAHELLQWICDNHPNTVDELPWAMVKRQFNSLGFSPDEREEAYASLRQHIMRLFSTSIGQWLIKAHQQERNEYELLINNEGLAATRIIDRTFVDNGIRWVIDFKTGSEEEAAQVKHRQQVNHYAQLLAMRSTEPVYCGLYYLASGHWMTWEYQPSLLTESLSY